MEQGWQSKSFIMITLIGLLLFAVFSFLSGIHFYWGLGGKFGGEAAIPTRENNEKVMNPKLFDYFVVAFGLLGFGIFILVKSQLLTFGLPNWLSHSGLWIITSLFLLRAVGEFKYVGFFKTIKTTQFGQMDTRFYSPLCLAISLLGIILELMK